jgi:molybdopterin converting factor small subunit
MVTVYIPTPFRRATANQDRIEVTAADVRSMLDELESSFGGLKGLVRDPAGTVHRHINISVNGQPIDGLGGLAAALHDGDEVAIIPALAGGHMGSRAR